MLKTTDKNRFFNVDLSESGNGCTILPIIFVDWILVVLMHFN